MSKLLLQHDTWEEWHQGESVDTVCIGLCCSCLVHGSEILDSSYKDVFLNQRKCRYWWFIFLCICKSFTNSSRCVCVVSLFHAQCFKNTIHHYYHLSRTFSVYFREIEFFKKISMDPKDLNTLSAVEIQRKQREMKKRKRKANKWKAKQTQQFQPLHEGIGGKRIGLVQGHGALSKQSKEFALDMEGDLKSVQRFEEKPELLRDWGSPVFYGFSTFALMERTGPFSQKEHAHAVSMFAFRSTWQTGSGAISGSDACSLFYSK